MSRLYSDTRKCCGCFASKLTSEMSRCSRCSVCVYCDRTCQLEHWKTYGHKGVCKPHHPKPPPFVRARPEAYEDLDFEALYNFIVVRPMMPTETASTPTQQQLYATVQGVDEDEGISALTATASVLGIDKQLRRDVCDKFGWLSGYVGSSLVPGFSQEYDGIRLVAYHDDSFKTVKGLEPNTVASLAMMRSQDEVKGVVVFVALDENNEIVKLTRGDIISTMEYNHKAGQSGSVSERIHFENMKRSSTLHFLKSSYGGQTQFMSL